MANGNDDETRLLQLFPNEVWVMILEEVKEARDYHQISSASPLFRTLLLPRAPEILFPEVVKLLVKDKSDLRPWLHVRQVCHSWRNGFDKMLQTPDYFQVEEDQTLMFKRSNNFREDRGPTVERFLGQAETFAKFEEHFDPTHMTARANPFISRRIHLYFSSDSEPLSRRYWTACSRFLRKYGEHVLVCSIEERMNYSAARLDFYIHWLPTLLELIPNLTGFDANLGGWRPNSEMKTQVETRLVATQFPTLPHLQYLNLYTPISQLVERVLETNPAVEMADTHRHPEMIPLYAAHLPNVTTLSLGLHNAEELQALRNAHFVGRVERLWLDASDANSVTWQAIFEVLEAQFSESVTELYLRLPFADRELDADSRLALPNLKKLRVEMEEARDVNFLLPMKETLEDLSLAFDHEYPPSKELLRAEACGPLDFIKVYTCWTEPRKSNVWTLFPKLMRLETKEFGMYLEWQQDHYYYDSYSCTRADWRAGMKGQQKK